MTENEQTVRALIDTVEGITLSFPWVLASNSDAEILEIIGHNNAVILKRFSAIRSLATRADAERDRLRDYVKTNIEVGRYEDVIYGLKNGGERFYANSAGNFALENYFTLQPLHLQRSYMELTAGLLDSKAENRFTVLDHEGKLVGSFALVARDTLGRRSEQQNINITVMPECP